MGIELLTNYYLKKTKQSQNTREEKRKFLKNKKNWEFIPKNLIVDAIAVWDPVFLQLAATKITISDGGS